jgi:hypothetical protein
VIKIEFSYFEAVSVECIRTTIANANIRSPIMRNESRAQPARADG